MGDELRADRAGRPFAEQVLAASFAVPHGWSFSVRIELSEPTSNSTVLITCEPAEPDQAGDWDEMVADHLTSLRENQAQTVGEPEPFVLPGVERPAVRHEFTNPADGGGRERRIHVHARDEHRTYSIASKAADDVPGDRTRAAIAELIDSVSISVTSSE